MAFFKMKEGVGGHREKVDGKWVRYHPGEVIESDIDLDKSFPSKFTRITPIVEEVVKSAAVVKEEAKAKAKEEIKAFEEPIRDPLGEDVSIEYPDAVDLDLLVFKATRGRATRYFVTNSEDQFRALNDTPLTKKGLKSFLQEQGE